MAQSYRAVPEVALTFIALLLGTGCHWRVPSNQIRVEVSLNTSKEARGLGPTNVTGMSCFFVDVSGPGINTSSRAADLGNVSLGCTGWGILSFLFSLADLQTGVSLSVPAGPGRII